MSEKKNKKERLADEIEQEELNILDEAEEAVEEEATADTLTEEQAKILELENKLDEVENRYLRMQAD
ncbi:nucleotide exchange factor GrpE, partial [Listeria monocytogenes]